MNLSISLKLSLTGQILICAILFINPLMLNSQHAKNDNLQILNAKSLQGERIFFIKKHNAGNLKIGDVYSMNPNGNDLQKLTNFSGSFAGTEMPKLSQDGTKLAFISNYESWKSMNYIDAFMADLITGKIERITGYEKTTPITNTGTVNVTVNDPRGYATTPSAIRISYKGCNNFATGNSATLTVPADEEIWIKAEIAKAKGDYKALTVPNGGNLSVTLDLTRGNLSAETCSPSFNGNYLAVSENSETISSNDGTTFSWYKVLVWDTKTKKELVEVGGFKQGADITPAYSPDDNFLALCTGEPALQSVGVVSTNNITALPDLIAYGNIIGYHAYCSNPTWSPDGKEIAYAYIKITTTLFDIEIESNLYRVPANGGDPVQVTFYSGKEVASYPSYSPDGSKIAFTHSVSEKNVFTLSDYINGTYSSDIYTIPTYGGNATIITTDGVSLDPTWGIVSSSVHVKDMQEHFGKLKLFQNYPNPFNPTTKIKYTISRKMNNSEVKLIIHNALGEKICTLVDEIKPAGTFEVEFDATKISPNISSGIYFSHLIVNDHHKINKMILIK